MGTFDYIVCEVPLPDGFKGELQTKDFDCELETHTITKEGRLILSRILRYEDVPKEQRPHPEAPDNSLLGICGSMRAVVEKVDSNHHGYVNFYGSEEIPGEPLRVWHEYNAKFTDGQLVAIKKA